MTLTASERTLRARIGAYALHAARDPLETTAAGRASFLGRWEREIRAAYPDLPDAEVARRTEAARKAHFVRLQYQSARARSKNRASRA